MSRDRQAHHKWLPQVLFSDIIIGKERIITVNVKSTELIGLTCSLRIDIRYNRSKYTKPLHIHFYNES